MAPGEIFHREPFALLMQFIVQTLHRNERLLAGIAAGRVEGVVLLALHDADLAHRVNAVARPRAELRVIRIPFAALLGLCAAVRIAAHDVQKKMAAGI